MNTKYQILLFYKYTYISDPDQLLRDQKEICERLQLKCRTLIAHEGINGTLEGTIENTEKYIEEMNKDPRFADIHWKKSEGTEDGTAFPRINIKVRPEIVRLRLDDEEDVGPLMKLEDGRLATADYITAEELHDLIHSDEEFYIIDMRNDYEHRVGYFENSILPAMANFRELPHLIHQLEKFKHKQVITVCTGGIRCEKASGYLLKKGFTNVRQLFGGIVTYMEKYPNEDFKGKLYVFDKRTLMGFQLDSPKHQVVSNCDRCGAISDHYVDCSNIHCKGNRHFICCNNCLEENGTAFCSENCKEIYAQMHTKIEIHN